ncbi:hypothetical protein OJAV_G00114140 [Oryzias javanicus]|uniref:C2H2-type domain-containing protein n=1 Tax=Oryzias javanicus TaxID=123683 RepID=A0A437CWW9_ORYJA|nr:hypothetical protein OJAV_G00114140 [Oryzias javanicus]
MSKTLLLRVSVNERISSAAEDIMLRLESGEVPFELPTMRILLTERLTKAAGQVIALFEKIVSDFEETLRQSEQKVCRQRKLLDAVLKPTVQLERAEIQQSTNNKENVSSEQLVRSNSLDENGVLPFQGLDLDVFLPPLSPEEAPDPLEHFWLLENELYYSEMQSMRAIPKPETFPCTMCGLKFSSIAALGFHLKVHKSKKKPKPRRLSDYERFSKLSLKFHKPINAVENVFTCSECKQAFKFRSMLRKHNCGQDTKPPFDSHCWPVEFPAEIKSEFEMEDGALTVQDRFRDVGTEPAAEPVTLKEELVESEISQVVIGPSSDKEEEENPQTSHVHHSRRDVIPASEGGSDSDPPAGDKTSSAAENMDDGGEGTSQSSAVPEAPKTWPSEERPLKCPFCSKSFITEFNMKIHVSMHTGQAVRSFW